MKPKTMILLVVAIGCGLVASYMTSRVIADRQSTEEAAKVPVVYAIKHVRQNQLINKPEEFFEQRLVPEDMAPKNRPIRELSQLAKKRVINAIGADKYVCEDDLLGDNASGLTYEVPPGMRAVAVRVSQETAGGGFVMPGNHVDIMCVPNGRNECHTILQRVLVLAVNSQLRKPEDGKTHIDTNIVTFAVSTDDANKLSLAAFSGNLRLALRHVDDEKVEPTQGAKFADLTRSTHVSSDPGESGDTSPTTQPVPLAPAPPLGQPVAAAPPTAEPVKPEPPQPKVLWVMKITQADKVMTHRFMEEQPIVVEKSDPTTGPQAPPAPAKKEPGGANPTKSGETQPPVEPDPKVEK